jgi:5-methylcytosine-specific restriction endonuclease McrA
MKRRFTQSQKRMLAWLAGGLCRLCGARLTQDFHADHVVPFSKGGATTVNNGQALCPRCNLLKGKKWN